MSECPICNNSFEPKNMNQKYCSHECKRKTRTECSNCKTKITRYKNKSNIYFCSRGCSEFYYGRRIKRKCRQCNYEFSVKSSSVSSGYGKYCSVDCADKSKEVSVTLKCPNCNDDFITKPNKVDRRHYCSPECYFESMMINIPETELYDMYINQRLSTRLIAMHFDTDKKVVCDYLKKYGIDTRDNVFPNKRLIICKNGTRVKSQYERAFVNEMLFQNIDFEYEPRLPFDLRYSSDFKVKDIYVEIWGMVEWDKYKNRMNKKKKMYKENNMNLFSVYPEDFKDVRGKVKELKNLIN